MFMCCVLAGLDLNLQEVLTASTEDELANNINGALRDAWSNATLGEVMTFLLPSLLEAASLERTFRLRSVVRTQPCGGVCGANCVVYVYTHPDTLAQVDAPRGKWPESLGSVMVRVGCVDECEHEISSRKGG